ncbi:excalibur calcium-binding domain-containing protein [Microbacterium radiodurans]|uniref:excalibur calcium-binding domain-containing protein n=1 Tax=Microbacterium radiodurans TaxID=661398 RepID=UPI001CC652A8|nr:excalibur calcium-binding domain-containing protein [Microbacterium radiodurans]
MGEQIMTDASEPEGRTPFLRRPMSRKAALIVSASTLVAGLIVGAGAGGSGAGSEITELKRQVSTLEVDVDDAETVALESDAALSDASSELADARADLATAKRELAAATAQVTEMQTAATGTQTELDARAARIADLEGQLSVRTAPAVQAPAPAAPAAPATIVVSYENCTAVRNAGAAPIRSGEPGYGRHLDRDGDGIGCE